MTLFPSAIGAVGSSLAITLGTITPAGWAALGVAATIVIVASIIDYAEEQPSSTSEERKSSPIGRRNNYNSRKKAKEAAKKAGGGKDPINHPKGFHGNKKPHFHPNVKNKFRLTPNAPSIHDHYFYPR